jgi:hypothetical protein
MAPGCFSQSTAVSHSRAEIEDEATHRPRQFGFEPSSFCMWGSKPAGMSLPNN